jgi:hypothetical protein
MMKQFIGFVIFLFAVSISSVAFSQTALTVVSMASQAEMTLTLDDLQMMDQVDIKTSNEFVDGEKLFRGPLVRAVLARFGAEDVSLVRLTAANDFQVEVPAHEFYDYDAILALSMDGVALSKREKGPIWVIYPMSDFSELRDPVYNSRLIWQLVKLEYQ